MTNADPVLGIALGYAQRGHPIFPIKGRAKEPLTDHGYHEATTDPDQIRAWWTRWPRANIGLACGHSADVLDVDGRVQRLSRFTRERITLLAFVYTTCVDPEGCPLASHALDALQRYPWPGNVRELKNVIEHALILCDSDVIEREHLPMAIRMGPSFGAADEATGLLTLEEAEKSYIRRVLHECKGHRQKAAHILGISERTLYRKLQEIGEIQPSP